MSSIDEQIRKAMEEGQFSNLKGKGKPLNLQENPHEDPEWKMAHRMLKNGGYTLPWIEMRQEILSLTDELRKKLAQTWAWRESALQRGQGDALVEAEWQRTIRTFREQADQINKRIRDYNLEIPSQRFHMPRINVDKEIETLGQGDSR